MTQPSLRVSRRLVPSAVVFALAGCTSLLTVSGPKHLYRITPKSSFPANLPRLPAQLLVDVPLAPAGLDTTRVALSRSPISLDYFADSEWTDSVPMLVQTALVASFENSKSIAAIDRESTGLRADFILKTEIRHFEAEYGAGTGPPNVWVAANARLVKMPDREIIAQGSFERHEPAAANDVPSIVLAFDEALGAVMKQIVVWTVTNPTLSGTRR
jgi:cholesterol transport system auxiliary component